MYMDPNNNSDNQLSKIIYHKILSIMKFTLDLEEQKYLEKGRNDERYRFFKKQLMSETYNTLRNIFSELESLGIVVPTEYEEDVKDGYRASNSGGSGYVNSPDFDEWLKS